MTIQVDLSTAVVSGHIARNALSGKPKLREVSQNLTQKQATIPQLWPSLPNYCSTRCLS